MFRKYEEKQRVLLRETRLGNNVVETRRNTSENTKKYEEFDERIDYFPEILKNTLRRKQNE